MITVRQNIETLRDKFDAFKDTVAFVRRGRSPKTLLERLRFAPYHMRERHVLRIMKRLGVTLDPAVRKHIESVLKGTADGSEGMPVCDVCLTAFEPNFESDDGIVSTATTCAGCLRTREKEREREPLLSEPNHVDPAPAVCLPGQVERVERGDDSAEERPVRP